MNQKTEHLRPARQSLIRRIFYAQLGLVAALCILVAVGFFWHAGSFFFGIFLGSLGGSIALLRQAKSENAAVVEELAAEMTSTLMPILYGGLMAGVAYLLFMYRTKS
jgi:hypothetical protein